MTFFLLLLLQLWISRIAAASREHGMKYPVLVHNLAKVSSITTFFFVYSAVIFMNTKCPPLSVCLQSSVQLNRRVISEMAITEPRTFLSLAKLAQARREEGFLAALGDGKEPNGVFSRIPLSR